MEDYSQYFKANKELWNKRTVVHKDSSFYDVAGFKTGKNILTPIELNELGDVKGKKMLHLQCHFGMDSLNWARQVSSASWRRDFQRLYILWKQIIHIATNEFSIQP